MEARGITVSRSNGRSPFHGHRPNQQPQLTINQSVQQVQQHTIDLREPHTEEIHTYVHTDLWSVAALAALTYRSLLGSGECRHVIWPPASTLSRQPLSSCAHKGSPAHLPTRLRTSHSPPIRLHEGPEPSVVGRFVVSHGDGAA
jgi:hypothetical protein